jgi:predicted nuclease of restriction endonuclease-like (RecB) superfamily
MKKKSAAPSGRAYTGLISGIGELLESARHATARVVNSFMTATYWEIGRRIVEFEQGGKKRAGYGEELLKRLSSDLSNQYGKGFSRPNLQRFREFYLCFPTQRICSTVSSKSHDPFCSTPSSISILPTMSGESPGAGPGPLLVQIAQGFPLPWSHYVRLLSARSDEARTFYEAEALRGGWSVRQLDRQINSLFYERTALSKNKTAMLKKGAKAEPTDVLTAEEAIRDPLVLEFLNLKDEYSETELEEALIKHLEAFLLELGGDFAFVGRQRRLRVDDEWYRVDLLFFHRRLRCLVIVDLKLGTFTHADAGQMHLYLNYAREHWTQPGENPPVGLILCSSAGQNIVRYSLDNLPNKVLAKEYRLALPEERRIADEITKARRRLGR